MCTFVFQRQELHPINSTRIGQYELYCTSELDLDCNHSSAWRRFENDRLGLRSVWWCEGLAKEVVYTGSLDSSVRREQGSSWELVMESEWHIVGNHATRLSTSIPIWREIIDAYLAFYIVCNIFSRQSVVIALSFGCKYRVQIIQL